MRADQLAERIHKVRVPDEVNMVRALRGVKKRDDAITLLNHLGLGVEARDWRPGSDRNAVAERLQSLG